MGNIRSERVPESPLDRAKRERRIARAYQSGVEFADIQRRFGISHAAIAEIVRRYNIPLRMPQRSRREKVS